MTSDHDILIQEFKVDVTQLKEAVDELWAGFKVLLQESKKIISLKDDEHF